MRYAIILLTFMALPISAMQQTEVKRAEPAAYSSEDVDLMVGILSTLCNRPDSLTHYLTHAKNTGILDEVMAGIVKSGDTFFIATVKKALKELSPKEKPEETCCSIQ